MKRLVPFLLLLTSTTHSYATVLFDKSLLNEDTSLPLVHLKDYFEPGTPLTFVSIFSVASDAHIEPELIEPGQTITRNHHAGEMRIRTIKLVMYQSLWPK